MAWSAAAGETAAPGARAGALTPECIEAGPALLRQAFIESGQQPSEEAIGRIVDNVLIPMLRAKDG